MFITRKQYDSLIEHHPKFMKDEYSKLIKSWSLGGVAVYGNIDIIIRIEEMLKSEVIA